jgi:hypothetical protein
MTDLDPYIVLGEKLIAAAERQASNDRATTSMRAWLSNRVNAFAITTVLVLAGGAIAVAASGILNGSPVSKVAGTPTPNSGTGVAVASGAQVLVLRAADPEGGLPWGIQVVRTTRGETCVQIGRVSNGQVGQLGIDGAFHNDGRFHPLEADILPNYTRGYASITCVLPGEVVLGYGSAQERNAEWGVGRKTAGVGELRTLSWGLLGPDAVSVTYRTTSGQKTIPVSAPNGAFMFVGPAQGDPRHAEIPGFYGGAIVGHRVGQLLGIGRTASEPGAVTRIVYRFGDLTCSVGLPAHGMKHCPVLPSLPPSAYQPTHSLHEPVQVKTLPQSHKRCDEEYLLYPCYRAQVEFKAPYAVTSAGTEYSIEAGSTCHNATPSSWSVIRNIKQGETVRTQSLGLFNCISTDDFQVRYVNSTVGALIRASHKSVIVGTGVLGNPAEVPRLEAQARRRLRVIVRRPQRRAHH